MRIVVTGAAGFVGSHLADRLLDAGHDVVGLDCFTDYYDPALKRRNVAGALARGMELAERDLAIDPLGDVLASADAVFHLAAQPGISAHVPFEQYLRNNVVATHRLVEACIAEPKTRRRLVLLVNVSTSSVYGRDATGPEGTACAPTSYYGVTKLAAEQLVMAAARQRGLRACSMRLFSVYGPRERPEKLFPRLIRAIQRSEPFPLYDGAMEHTRTFTYVGDAVLGLVAALERAPQACGEIFNIGSDNETRTEHGIRIVERIMGRAARFERLAARPGDQERTRADIAKASRELGYSPETTPQRGLEQTVQWFETAERDRAAATGLTDASAARR